MSAEVIGEAQVLIEARFEDFDKDVQDRLVAAAHRAGLAAEKELKQSGARAGKGFSDGVSKAASSTKTLDSITASVKRLEAAAARAGDVQADAAGRVRVAEENLAKVKAKAPGDTARITAAEERLAKARRDSVRASNLAQAATEALQGARAKLVAEGQRLGQATGEAFIDGVEKAAGRGAPRAGNDAGNFFSRAFRTAAARGLGQALFTTAIVSAGALVTALSPLSTVLGGAAAAVVALAGALSQAAGASVALLGILGSLGLAIGTIKVASSGLGDALKAQSAAQKELTETGKISEATQKKLDAALKGLAPSARAVVLELGKMAPRWKEVQQAIQEKFFTGLSTVVADLGNRFLPLLNQQLGTAATTLNRTTVEVGKYLASWRGSKQVNDIFSQLNGILRVLLQPLTVLTRGFLDIFQASLPFALQLATTLSTIGTNFGNWLSRISESGAFTEFMQTAMTLAGDLFKLLGNIGSIIGSVFAAGAETGGGLLQILRDLTGNLATFLKSTEGKADLKAFFDLAAQAGQIVAGIFQTLAPLFAGVRSLFQALQPPIKIFGQVLQGVTGVLSKSLGAALTALGPVLGRLISAFGPLVTTIGSALNQAILILTPVVLALVEGFTNMLPGINAVVTALSGVFLSLLGQLAGIFVQLLPVIGQIAGAFLAGLAPVLQLIGENLVTLIEPLVQIVQSLIAVLPVLLPLIPAFAALNLAVLKLLFAFLPLVTTVLQLFAEQAASLAPAIAAVIPWVILIVEALTRFVLKLVEIITPIVAFGATLLRVFAVIDLAILGFIFKVATAIVGFGIKIVSTAITYGNRFGAAFRTAIANVVTFFAGLPGKVNTQLAKFVAFVKSSADKAVTFFQGLPGRISAALSGIGSTLYQAGQDAVQGLINGLRSKLAEVVAASSSIGGAVKAGIGGLLQIKSPSRVTYEQGEQAAQGIINALLAKASAVAAAAGKLVAGIPQEISTGVAVTTTLADALLSGLRRPELDTQMVRLADVMVGRIREGLGLAAPGGTTGASAPVAGVSGAIPVAGGSGASTIVATSNSSSSKTRTVEVPINVQGSVVDYAALVAVIKSVLEQYGFKPVLGLTTAGGAI